MWDKVMDMLDAAREERFDKQSVRMRVHLAHHLSADGSEGGTRVLRFALSHAIRWTPGDTVAALPVNNPRAVDAVLRALGASGRESIDLSAKWYRHLDAHPTWQGRTLPRSVPLAEIIRHAQLDPVR